MKNIKYVNNQLIGQFVLADITKVISYSFFLVISTTGGNITNEQGIQSYLEQIQAMLHRSI